MPADSLLSSGDSMEYVRINGTPYAVRGRSLPRRKIGIIGVGRSKSKPSMGRAIASDLLKRSNEVDYLDAILLKLLAGVMHG
jgi:hypothetical protein